MKLLAAATFLSATFLFLTDAEPTTLKTKFSTDNTTSEVAPPETPDNAVPELTWEEEINLLYDAFSKANESEMPSIDSFADGIKGYEQLRENGELKKELLTLIDFSLPSTEKRLWVLDMENNEVLFHTYVSHGRNTGGKMATKFSNENESFQSSLGFYVTAETYYGKNGLSLFLDGKEEGFNDNARSRYVVMHGADYSNPDFITRTGRLGRSLGCPAVPEAEAKDIIGTIKGKSVLFIYHTDPVYQEHSDFLNADFSGIAANLQD